MTKEGWARTTSRTFLVCFLMPYIQRQDDIHLTKVCGSKNHPCLMKVYACRLRERPACCRCGRQSWNSIKRSILVPGPQHVGSGGRRCGSLISTTFNERWVFAGAASRAWSRWPPPTKSSAFKGKWTVHRAAGGALASQHSAAECAAPEGEGAVSAAACDDLACRTPAAECASQGG